MHCLYVGVASVINEANMSNDIFQQLTYELNGRSTYAIDDSWLSDSFQRTPLEHMSTPYGATGIIKYPYQIYISCIVLIH